MSFKQILLVITIAVVAVAMTACGSAVKSNPKIDDTVYGNGGMQVRKGNYVYFMNGFYGVDEITDKTNKDGKVVRGGIYRVELTDGALPVDEDGNVTGAVRIVSKITCYEFGGFYIYDNYIYYATPNNQKDKSGTLLKDRVDFYRCKIDGSDNKRIYTTESTYSSVKFNVLKFNKDAKTASTYLTILDGSDLISFEFNKGNNKGKTEIAEDVTGVAWSEIANYEYNQSATAFEQTVFFTQATTDTNKISSYNLTTEETKVIVDNNTATYTLKGAVAGKLYYEKALNGSTVFAGNTLGSSFENSENIYYNNSYSSYFVVGGEQGDFEGGVIATNDSGTYFVKSGANGETSRTTITRKKYNILFSNGSKVYVRESAVQIYVIDLTDATFEAKEILGSDVEGKNDASKYVDFDGRFITYLATNTVDDTTTYYTHLVDLSQYDEADGYLDVFVGEYAKGEKPSTDDTDSE